jgi:hypothetical protein
MHRLSRRCTGPIFQADLRRPTASFRFQGDCKPAEGDGRFATASLGNTTGSSEEFGHGEPIAIEPGATGRRHIHPLFARQTGSAHAVINGSGFDCGRCEGAVRRYVAFGFDLPAAVCAVLVAQPNVAAAVDEIQLYNAEIAEVGQFTSST